jgi:hypothetical protein
MAFESTQSFKPQITGDPSNRSYSVKVLDDGTTIITQQEITGGRTATQVMGRIAKKGTFIPEKIGSQTLPNTDQIKYFTENSTDIVKNYSIPTVLTGIGGSAGGGYAKVNEILGTNFSPPTPTPGSATPPDPNAITLETLGDINFDIKPREAVKIHGNYKYPLEMPDDMDKINFAMIEYRGRAFKENKLGFKERFSKDDRNNTRLGTVTMGIQPRISDNNSVSWNDMQANALGLLGGAASLQLIQDGASGISNLLNKIGNTLGAEKTNIENAIKLEIAGQAAGINGLISRIGGGILNPNLELLFEAPQLRPFDFTFQLTPRDSNEAKQVKQIIRFFKQGMAVQRTAADLFLKAPNVFEIKYLFGKNKQEHPGLNKIKTCALQNCSVDYTPTGSYMTFPDGTMTAYNITLSFKELEPVYSDEYQDPTDNETVESVQIGF